MLAVRPGPERALSHFCQAQPAENVGCLCGQEDRRKVETVQVNDIHGLRWMPGVGLWPKPAGVAVDRWPGHFVVFGIPDGSQNRWWGQMAGWIAELVTRPCATWKASHIVQVTM